MEILIVEDEVLICELTRRTLMNLGYRVLDPVHSGEDAVTAAGNHKPDLILMDIALQGEMDGITAAQKIHDMYEIPIIYVSGHANDSLLERAKPTEPYAYILKPFNDRELHMSIELAIYKHKHRHDSYLALSKKGIIPICSQCKKIRDENGEWQHIVKFIQENSNILFTHGLCPECFAQLYLDIDMNEITDA